MRDTIYREDAINVLEKLSACEEYGVEVGTDEETYIGKYEAITAISDLPSADRPQGEWIPCSERLPETDNTNEINEFDVLLAVRPKKHPEKTPQVYIGKLRPVEGDDGSGNFWGIKTAPCEWTIWGWSYFQEPEVLAWMPLPQPYKRKEEL